MSRQPKPEALSELKELQRMMASLLFRPLTPDWTMQRKLPDGRLVAKVAATFIKPNDRLDSFERLEIYNRQYWFRVLDCLHDDFPGLRSILGDRLFLNLTRAYLQKHPSQSYTLRNLGSRLEEFIRSNPAWCGIHQKIALDMTKFEWAQTVAFDGANRTSISTDDILDASPDTLILGLQPTISLLKLRYAVDEYFVAVRKLENEGLRNEASNARAEKPQKSTRARRLPLPKSKALHLVVHRFDNQIYFKQLEPTAYRLLSKIKEGKTLAEACFLVLGANPSVKTATKIRIWFSEWTELGWLCKPFKHSES